MFRMGKNKKGELFSGRDRRPDRPKPKKSGEVAPDEDEYDRSSYPQLAGGHSDAAGSSAEPRHVSIMAPDELEGTSIAKDPAREVATGLPKNEDSLGGVADGNKDRQTPGRAQGNISSLRSNSTLSPSQVHGSAFSPSGPIVEEAPDAKAAIPEAPDAPGRVTGEPIEDEFEPADMSEERRKRRSSQHTAQTDDRTSLPFPRRDSFSQRGCYPMTGETWGKGSAGPEFYAGGQEHENSMRKRSCSRAAMCLKNSTVKVPRDTSFIARQTFGESTLRSRKRLGNLRSFRSWNVELDQKGLSRTVLWMPDQATPEEPWQELEGVTVVPREVKDGSLVLQDDAFEIRVVGMKASAFDKLHIGSGRKNELVLYSLHGDDGDKGEEESEAYPIIHYDYREARSLEPDKYQDIASTNSLVLFSGAEQIREYVNARFKMIEVDPVDTSVAEALSNVQDLGSHLGGLSFAAPYISLLNPVLGLAGKLGKVALDSYSNPDTVIEVDMNLRLAEREEEKRDKHRPGNFLRYGYYYFLSRPVNHQLFASPRQTNNYELMVYVEDSKKFEPLCGVSYVVVRVQQPMSKQPKYRAGIGLTDARRLQSILGKVEKEVDKEDGEDGEDGEDEEGWADIKDDLLRFVKDMRSRKSQ